LCHTSRRNPPTQKNAKGKRQEKKGAPEGFHEQTRSRGGETNNEKRRKTWDTKQPGKRFGTKSHNEKRLGKGITSREEKRNAGHKKKRSGVMNMNGDTYRNPDVFGWGGSGGAIRKTKSKEERSQLKSKGTVEWCAPHAPWGLGAGGKNKWCWEDSTRGVRKEKGASVSGRAAACPRGNLHRGAFASQNATGKSKVLGKTTVAEKEPGKGQGETNCKNNLQNLIEKEAQTGKNCQIFGGNAHRKVQGGKKVGREKNAGEERFKWGNLTCKYPNHGLTLVNGVQKRLTRVETENTAGGNIRR